MAIGFRAVAIPATRSGLPPAPAGPRKIFTRAMRRLATTDAVEPSDKAEVDASLELF